MLKYWYIKFIGFLTLRQNVFEVASFSVYCIISKLLNLMRMLFALPWTIVLICSRKLFDNPQSKQHKHCTTDKLLHDTFLRRFGIFHYETQLIAVRKPKADLY